MHTTEATTTDGAALPGWRKSSYSGGDQGECLEVAYDYATLPVRDSKIPGGPTLTFSRQGWTRFVAAVKHDEFTA
ncbi:DUF397 domain-containing protein [Streptomyces sp. NPDC007346]|uniref:DUF397 domain-containing protein n=1 Tax=Streptomyces sp. NPDC007346 TaxID=3154682 RepID=UPI003453D371